MDQAGTSRKATHAGSWYTDNPSKLKDMISSFMSKAEKRAGDSGLVKYVIGPHAGYSYCAETEAWAYKNIDPDKYKRVIIIGPSHFVPINYCALTECERYETPLGDMKVDKEVVNKLLDIKGFKTMDIDIDEQEHSLEMHMPFIKYLFGERKVSIVPMMVGNISHSQEKEYGKILAEYMKDNETLFSISSDFCHWGMRFGYTYYHKEDGQIYQSIEKLDRRGMDIMEKNDVSPLDNYFDETENTICGRHAISIAVRDRKSVV